MFTIHKIQRTIAGKEFTLETGRIARQAHGAVTVQCGETIILATAVTADPREGIDFFPLSVDYREKFSAAGKFKGGFMKREGRPSEKETLTARMIDRPIRPLFPDGYFDEVQILITVFSFDQQNDPDILGMIGASAALAISKIPFQGPLGACRVSRVNGQFVVNPTYPERDKSDFNLVLAGRRDAMNMIEVDARETKEEAVTEAIALGQTVIAQVCDMIDELVAKCGVPKELPDIETDTDGKITAKIRSKIGGKLRDAYQITQKSLRQQAVRDAKDALKDEFFPEESETEPICSEGLFSRLVEKIEEETVRTLILEGKRPDGRSHDQLRQISCEVGLLPRAHGSALFTRGETQALVSATLGTGRDEQIIDGLLEEYGQRFMLHYSFPPSSVGEVRPIRGPGRREIGHGALAEKALEQVRPEQIEFPYTIKIASDITESNGSSSMASICGGCLAMMDAGVPIKRPVAGISIGLVSAPGRHVLLTDIVGDEDHFGDMDFKIAGTTEGITAIQLDIKSQGLDFAVMKEAVYRARDARLEILRIMATAIDKPRSTMSQYAPRIVIIKIDPEYIGKVIGPGGSMVKGIQEQTKSVIEIEEDGTIMISSTGGSEGHLVAKSIIENMTTPPQVGRVYENARVVTVKEFGAFVEMTPGVEGLCHISELSDGYIKSVDEVCKVGDHLSVKLIAIDDQGRFKLSRKAVLLADKPEGQNQGQDQGQGGQGHGQGGRPRREEKNRSGHRPPNNPRV